MLVIISVTAHLASADVLKKNLREKGTNSMHQAATASLRDLPPLDVSQPSRVETFTFGLG
jgi:hypothetical protein